MPASVHDARDRARAALDGYDELDREERRDADLLGEHAETLQSALDRLVNALGASKLPSASPELGEQLDSASETLTRLRGAAELDSAQHVRRACYLLRRETKGLLAEVDAVAA